MTNVTPPHAHHGIQAATAKAIRAVAMLKQACTELNMGGAQAEQALSMANYIIDQWEMEREKIFALVTCLTSKLAPLDPKNPADNDKFTEWNIALVIEDILGDIRTINSLRVMVKP